PSGVCAHRPLTKANVSHGPANLRRDDVGTGNEHGFAGVSPDKVEVVSSRYAEVCAADVNLHFAPDITVGELGVKQDEGVRTGGPLGDWDLPHLVRPVGKRGARTRYGFSVENASLGPDDLCKEIFTDPTAAELSHRPQVFQHVLGDGAGRLRDVDPGER